MPEAENLVPGAAPCPPQAMWGQLPNIARCPTEDMWKAFCIPPVSTGQEHWNSGGIRDLSHSPLSPTPMAPHYRSFFVIPDEFANCRFWLCEELSWNFGRDSIKSVVCFLQDSHFYYIDPANPLAWEIFPSSEILFNFFLQRLDVLIIQNCHYLR